MTTEEMRQVLESNGYDFVSDGRDLPDGVLPCGYIEAPNGLKFFWFNFNEVSIENVYEKHYLHNLKNNNISDNIPGTKPEPYGY